MRKPHARTSTRIALTAGLALAATPLVGIAPAYACSCAGGSESEHYERADVVFKADLLKRVVPPPKPAPDGKPVPRGPGEATYYFAVTETYKGRTTYPQRVRTSASGASCGLELEREGGGPFLVFAREYVAKKGAKAPAHYTLEAGLCGGSRPVGENEIPSFARMRPAPQPATPQPAVPPEPGPVPPIEPVEQNPELAGPFGPIAREAQHFANRLIGPLLEGPGFTRS